MPQLSLYSYCRSSAAFRVRIALNVKQLSYETRYIHLLKNGGEQHQTDYVKRNPQHLVPSLDIDGDPLNQSLAIIEYIEETYPDPPLLPRDPLERAKVRAFALAVACDIHPLNNLRVLNYLESELKIDATAKSQWYCHWIQLGFAALESRLAATNKNNDYCFGDAMSLADIVLVPQVYNALRFKCAMDEFPRINAIYENCMAATAFYDAAPEQQVDFQAS